MLSTIKLLTITLSLLVTFAIVPIIDGKECKRPQLKLFCYYSKVNEIDGNDYCQCSHVVLPTDADVKAIERIRSVQKDAKILVTVHEFNEGIINLLKTSQVDGVEVKLRKIASRNDVDDFIATVKNKLGANLYVVVSVPPKPDLLAKFYDFKTLTKRADAFVLETSFLGANDNVTFHPSPLSGLWDMQNTDSVVDLVTGLGAPLAKLVITAPVQGLQFTLQDAKFTAPGSAAVAVETIPRNELCALMSHANWTLERDQDQAAPYIFRNKQWIAFEDATSMDIKAKYARVRGLAGLALKDLSQDGDRCGYTALNAAHGGLSRQARAPRGAVLRSLEREILETPARPFDNVRVSPYRISRVIDVEGRVHVVRKDTRTEFACSRQGYFVHPRSCGRFYRCVKFDQLTDEFSVFEFDCPAGLVFDERVEVCVWPGSLPHSSPCAGSSEIAPVPRERYVCPHEAGYYADPENCRWFFACLDHGRSGLTAYEFRCPFGLVFDQERLVCEWPWLVPKCGDGSNKSNYYVYGGGSGIRIAPSGTYTIDSYDGLGVLGTVKLGGLAGPLRQPQAKYYSTHAKDATLIDGRGQAGYGHATDRIVQQHGIGSDAHGVLFAHGAEGVQDQSLHGVSGGIAFGGGNFHVVSGGDVTTSGEGQSHGFSISHVGSGVRGKSSQGVSHGLAIGQVGQSVDGQEGQISHGAFRGFAFGEESLKAHGILAGDATSSGKLSQGIGINHGLADGFSVAGHGQIGHGGVSLGQGDTKVIGVTSDDATNSQEVSHGFAINYGRTDGFNAVGQTSHGASGGFSFGQGGSKSSGISTAGTLTDTQQTLHGFAISHGQGDGVNANTDGQALHGTTSGQFNFALNGGSQNDAISTARGSLKSGSLTSSQAVSHGITINHGQTDGFAIGHGQTDKLAGVFGLKQAQPVDVSNVNKIFGISGGNYRQGHRAEFGDQLTFAKSTNTADSTSDTFLDGAYDKNGNFGTVFGQKLSSAGGVSTQNQVTHHDSSTFGLDKSVGSQVGNGAIASSGGIRLSNNYVGIEDQLYTFDGANREAADGNRLVHGGGNLHIVSDFANAAVKSSNAGFKINHGTTSTKILQTQATLNNVGSGHLDGNKSSYTVVSSTAIPIRTDTVSLYAKPQEQQSVLTDHTAYNVDHRHHDGKSSSSINIVGSGFSAVGGALNPGVRVTHDGTNVEHSSAAVATPTPFTFVSTTPVPIITSVPLPVTKTITQFDSLNGGVIANTPDLQYKVTFGASNASAIESTYSSTITHGGDGAGYHYGKPAVAFEDGFGVIKEDAEEPVQHTPSVFVQQHRPTGFVHTARVAQEQSLVDANYGNRAKSFAYVTKPSPTIHQTTARPSVVSSFSISHDGGHESNRGYVYDRPKIRFDEGATAIAQKPTESTFTFHHRPTIVSTHVNNNPKIESNDLNSYTQSNDRESIVNFGQKTTTTAVHHDNNNYHLEEPVIIGQFGSFAGPVTTPTPTTSHVTGDSQVAKQLVHSHATYNHYATSAKETNHNGYVYERPSVAFHEEPVLLTNNQNNVDSYISTHAEKGSGPINTFTQTVHEEEVKPAVISKFSISHVAPTHATVVPTRPAPQSFKILEDYDARRTESDRDISFTKQIGLEETLEARPVTLPEQKTFQFDGYHYERPNVQFDEKPSFHFEQKEVRFDQTDFGAINQKSNDQKTFTGYNYEKPAIPFEEEPQVNSKPIDYQYASGAEKTINFGESYDFKRLNVKQQQSNQVFNIQSQTNKPIDFIQPSVTPYVEVSTAKPAVSSYFYQNVKHENTGYENRQPVKEEPFIAKTAYITGDEGYHYDKPAVAFEEVPQPIQPTVGVDFGYSAKNEFKLQKSGRSRLVANYKTPRPTLSSTVASIVAPTTTATPLTFFSYDSRLSSVSPSSSPFVPVYTSTVRPQYVTNPTIGPIKTYSSVSTTGFPSATTTVKPEIKPIAKYSFSSFDNEHRSSFGEGNGDTRTYLPSKIDVNQPTDEFYESYKQIPSLTTTARPSKTTVVKVNDYHPFLSAKLGAQCTCVSNVLKVRKRPVAIANDAKYVVAPRVTAGVPRGKEIVVEDYKSESTPRTVDYTVEITPKPEINLYQSTSGTIKSAPVPLIKKRVRVRPVLTSTASSYVEEEQYLRETTKSDKAIADAVRTGLSLVKEAVKQGVKEGVKESADTKTIVDGHKFDRYGPGGWRSRDETLQGTIDCQRAGLFRHPSECNKFYSCRWDCTKNRYTLHVFNCPVHLTFDGDLGACNWPSQGPACVGNTLLPSD